MYTSGNVTLMVSDFNRAVSFYTDGIEQAVRDLQAKGVQFTAPGIIDTGVERLANFADPDQTPLYLYALAHHSA